MSISAVHIALYLSMLWETGNAAVFINYARTCYEMQLLIGKLKYTLFHITFNVRVYIITGRSTLRVRIGWPN